MQLKLSGDGRAVVIESSIDGFADIVRQAVAAAAASGVTLSDDTASNLAALGIGTEPSPGGASWAT